MPEFSNQERTRARRVHEAGRTVDEITNALNVSREFDRMKRILDDQPRLLAHPDQAELLAIPAEAYGIRLQVSELVPPGQALLVNPAALRVEFDTRSVLEPVDDLWSPTQDALRMQYQTEVRVRARMVPESDPFFRPMPVVLVHSWRELPRKLWQVVRNHARRSLDIIGYERRKAAGQLRRHADPRDFAKITGLDG